MIEIGKDDSPRANIGRCNDLLESELPDLLSATHCLDRLAEMELRSELEADLVKKAREKVYAAFSKAFRSQQFAHRAWCTPPADIQQLPVIDSDLSPED